MNTLLFYIVSIWVTSLILFFIALLAVSIDSRLRNWPAFWASCLFINVFLPILGILISLIPSLGNNDVIQVLSLHEPLGMLSDEVNSRSREVSVKTPFNLDLVIEILVFTYISGVAFLLLRLGIGRTRIRQIANTAESVQLSLGQEQEILVSNKVVTPIAYSRLGQSNLARIIFPRSFIEKLSFEQLQYIYSHEQTHILRRDDEMGMILRVLLAINWISPLSQVLLGKWLQSTEIQCDRATTLDYSTEMRRAYANTLLDALHIMANRVRQYPVASFSTHHIRNEKMRITHILAGNVPSFKKPRHKIILGAISCCLTLAGAMSIAATELSEKSTTAATDVNFMLTGRLSSPYGPRSNPINNAVIHTHNGVDVAAPIGTPIYAPADGVVITATDLFDNKPNYGKVVIIETENNIKTMFSHLANYSVYEGQKINKGTKIAEVGVTGKTTGPHVHIETLRNNERLNPEDVWPIRIQ